MFKSFSHKRKYCDILAGIHDDHQESLTFDHFSEHQFDDFKQRLVALGQEIHREAGMVGMFAIHNYLGTSYDDNFGHDLAGRGATHMKMLVERVWSGIGDWQY